MIQNLFVVCVLSLLQAIAFSPTATAQLETAGELPKEANIGIGTAGSPIKRVAVVIGNSDYAKQPLRTPRQDARGMRGLLASMGFEIIALDNAGAAHIRRALDDLNTRLGKNGIGLFYFAGHGVQLQNSKRLLPIDATTDSPSSLWQSSIEVSEIIDKMSRGRPHQPKLVILDICLNKLFATETADSGYHQKRASRNDQTLLAFAAAPGEPAFEGFGQHSIYTAELIRVMSEPGLTANEIFTRVRHAVSHKTGLRQTPWIASSIRQPLYLTEPVISAPMPPRPTQTALPETALLGMLTRGILPKDGEAQYEMEFWQSIKDSTDAADYEAYLEAYPDGKFAPLAKSRAERYKKEAPVQAKQVKPPALIITDMNVDYVVVRTANIRQEPSAKSKRLGELKQGSTVHVTGQVSDSNWYQVKSATGVMGFVFGDLLKKPAEKPKAPATPAPSTTPEADVTPMAEPAPSAPPAADESDVIRDCPSCPELIPLPAGTFTMGDNRGDKSERPAHTVTIKRPFAIGKYEVTTGQWNECVKAGACSYDAAKSDASENSPVRDISWNDAQEYVRWLSQITKQEYRLPTEAEWEYATRANTKTRFWWGNKVGNGNANCKDCGGKWDRKSPADVADYPANPFGLYGTNGGVWEWVSDCWHKTYNGAPKDGSSWDKADCRENVIRGGSWRNDATYIHSASRFKYDSSVRYLLNGFRVAKTLRP